MRANKYALLTFLASCLSLSIYGQNLITDKQYPCINEVVTYTFIGYYNCSSSNVYWTIPGAQGWDYVFAPDSPPTGNIKKIIWKNAISGLLIAECPTVRGDLQVNVNSVAPFQVTGINEMCEGEVANFQIVNPPSNVTNYSWSVPAGVGTFNLSQSGQVATFNLTPDYLGYSTTLTVTGFTCSQDANYTTTFELLVKQNPSAPSGMDTLQFCDFETVVLSSSLPNYTSYNWYDSQNQFIKSARQAPYKILQPGKYQFLAESILNQCTSQSKATLIVEVIDSCDRKLHRIENWNYNYLPRQESSDSQAIQMLIGNSKSYFSSDGILLQAQSKSFSTGEIFTAQSVNDEMGRPVITSLSAPTGKNKFQYKHHFLVNQDGELYSHQDFGQPVGADNPNTVGWYYSAENNNSPEHPKSGFPFIQSEYYSGDIGGVKRSASVGEVLRMGSEHEILQGTFPVFDELAEYGALQSANFPISPQIGGTVSISRDVNGKYTFAVSNQTGNLLMTGRSTGITGLLTVTNSVTSSTNPNSADYRLITPFYLLHEQAIMLSGTATYIIENMITGERKVTFANTLGKWPVGFYRLILTGNTGEVNLQYVNNFSDLSFSFYDEAGRNICTITPKGFQDYKQGTTFNTIEKNTAAYDFKGQLLEATSADAGKTKYLYRQDGAIRFSQNAHQLSMGRFSYTFYDRYGRAIESGEYKGSKQFDNLNVDLEYIGPTNYTLNEKSNWTISTYDFPDIKLSEAAIGGQLTQKFVLGGVSFTQNVHNKTWYSYDELGRSEWIATKPTNLNRIFVIKYLYDFVGNVLSASNYSYQWSDGVLINQFHHHYEYDADQRLSKAYTSLTETGEKTLRATYFYYLHGPLKRIELGNKVQGVDFVYNIQGWLTQINHPVKANDPGHDTNDAFGMVIDYYESDIAPVVSSNDHQGFSPNKFHGLPEPQLAAQQQQPLIRFEAPQLNVDIPFKEHSAENPKYKKMLERAEN